VKKFIVFTLILFSVTAQASQFDWSLQITDPQFELQNTPLPDSHHKQYLPKTAWRCSVSEIVIKGGIESRELSCDYSIEKTGAFTTYTSCSNERDYSESKVTLSDERKNLTFQLLLLCRSRSKSTP
jgi:hypothetical protein